MTYAFSLITAVSVGQSILGVAFGALLGACYFQTLWWNVHLLTSGSAWRAIGLHILRFGVLVASLYAVSRFGAVPLIFAAMGVLAGRALVLRRVRRLQ
jgi:F1F0 ATPase subunit 2